MIAAAILVSALVLPSMTPRMAVQEAHATSNLMLGSFIAQTGTAKDLKYIEYRTKTTKSNPYAGPPGSCIDPPDLPGWCNFRYTDAYLVSGIGSDNYWYQCGVKYVVTAQKWVLDWEVFDTNANNIRHIHMSTTIPSNTNVNIKLGVASYTGSSGVSCVVSWSGNSVSYTDARNPSYFKRSSAPNADGFHTSVMSEYMRYTGDNVSPSTLGTVTYTPILLVDTSGTSTSVTQVTQLISDTVNPAQTSGPSSLPKSFTYPSSNGYTVSTSSTGVVTTT